jgi:hypothetical protein
VRLVLWKVMLVTRQGGISHGSECGVDFGYLDYMPLNRSIFSYTWIYQTFSNKRLGVWNQTFHTLISGEIISLRWSPNWSRTSDLTTLIGKDQVPKYSSPWAFRDLYVFQIVYVLLAPTLHSAPLKSSLSLVCVNKVLLAQSHIHACLWLLSH